MKDDSVLKSTDNWPWVELLWQIWAHSGKTEISVFPVTRYASESWSANKMIDNEFKHLRCDAITAC